eukprot:TRINITY_DN50612_c0_g1_i1.p1 TRINITY_DN50612_c0_g1~~TRINITY_DN50612_c0_g1_i1.p1  ORF type:complete len:111 (-),score=18.94 TRINITY_DN50612_c0_g1_i1:193-525(-)
MMKIAIAIAAVLALATADIVFYRDGSCGQKVDHDLPQDTCVALDDLTWAGSQINSVYSEDRGNAWYFSANTDDQCTATFVEAQLVKSCIEISPPFTFQGAGAAGSMEYDA